MHPLSWRDDHFRQHWLLISHITALPHEDQPGSIAPSTRPWLISSHDVHEQEYRNMENTVAVEIDCLALTAPRVLLQRRKLGQKKSFSA